MRAWETRTVVGALRTVTAVGAASGGRPAHCWPQRLALLGGLVAPWGSSEGAQGLPQLLQARLNFQQADASYRQRRVLNSCRQRRRLRCRNRFCFCASMLSWNGGM
jgi:hypothetical protein